MAFIKRVYNTLFKFFSPLFFLCNNIFNFKYICKRKGDGLLYPKRFQFILICFCCVFIPDVSYAELTAKTYVDTIASSKVNTVDLASIIAAAITGKEDTTNKIKSVSGGGTGITSSSTDTGYPSAKAVYDLSTTKVSLTGDETIGGTKTFSTGPIVPTPTYPTL